MLDRSEYLVLFNSLKRYVSLLAEEQAFFSNKEWREAIATVSLSSLNLLKFLGEKAEEEKGVDELIGKFRKNFSVEKDAHENFENYFSKSFDEIKDEINYLRVCLKNICNVDLDSADIENWGKSVNSNRLRIYGRNPDSLVIFKNIFNEADPGFSSTNQDNEELVSDFLLLAHARERLNKDIDDGIIYIYKTKPRINLRVKYALIFLFCTLLLFSVALFLTLIFFGSREEIISRVTNCLACILSSTFSAFNLNTIKKGWKNDNHKYSFQKTSLYGVFLFCFVWTLLNSGFPLVEGKVVGVLSKLLFVNLACIFILYLISYIFLQPEKDRKTMDDALKQHMSDLSKDIFLK